VSAREEAAAAVADLIVKMTGVSAAEAAQLADGLVARAADDIGPGDDATPDGGPASRMFR